MLVFDVESVPDEELIRAHFKLEGSGIELCLRALEMHKEKSGSTFLPHPFHKIVAIAGVMCDEYGRFVSVGSFPKGESSCDERSLIESFLSFVDEKNPKLVSFNGRAFDMPLILLRAMIYNISCYSFFEERNDKINKSKWDNYRSRYSESFHLDLYDTIGHYGAMRPIKLDLLCQMAGIPGKYDVDGSQVMELFYENREDKIREYCESDVINTYLLFLKYSLLKSNISLEDYYSAIEIFGSRIPRDRGYSDIFIEFSKNELKRA